MSKKQHHGAHLLVVEDDWDFRSTLVDHLRSAHYRVDAAPNSFTAWAWLRRQLPDLILLDLGLPDMSGLELCRRIRRDPRLERVPVLMLTALGAEAERVAGFMHGSDDYIVKPVPFAELLWRIQAVLRRTGGRAPSCLRLERLEIFPDGSAVRVDDTEVRLSRNEYALLLELAEANGRICSRDSLLQRVWHGGAEVDSRVVDTTVKRLRRALGPAGQMVRTHKGFGYSLRAADGDERAQPAR